MADKPATFTPSEHTHSNITLTAGDELSGGGTLAANMTFNVDSTVVRTTGNQSLAGNKTFTGSIFCSQRVRFTGSTSAFEQTISTNWVDNPGADKGVIAYHSHRWMIAAGSNSSVIATFRNDSVNRAHINNDGSYVQGSSGQRFKTLLTDIPVDALQKLSTLTTTWFEYNDLGEKHGFEQGKQHFRLIAQEV